jgi:phage-related protein
MTRKQQTKPLSWVGSSRKDLKEFPDPVKDVIGHALFIAQLGGKHEDAKPLRGYGGAGVLEVVEDSAGDTYRAVYTVKFADAIYVLHVFQKKSKKGIKTPQKDLDLIKERLRRAEQDHASWSKSGD